jgi:hypothetical protein
MPQGITGQVDKNREIGMVSRSTDLTVLNGDFPPMRVAAPCSFIPNAIKSGRIILVVVFGQEPVCRARNIGDADFIE